MRNLLPLGVKHLSSRLARHMLITINLNAGLSARRAKGAKMRITTIEGKTRDKNIQLITVHNIDKYGVAMIAYFKNSLNGQNVERLTVKDAEQVQLFYNRINGVYTLQILKFSISKDCILSQYRHFKNKYDTLIKDKIAHI